MPLICLQELGATALNLCTSVTDFFREKSLTVVVLPQFYRVLIHVNFVYNKHIKMSAAILLKSLQHVRHVLWCHIIYWILYYWEFSILMVGPCLSIMCIHDGARVLLDSSCLIESIDSYCSTIIKTINLNKFLSINSINHTISCLNSIILKFGWCIGIYALGLKKQGSSLCPTPHIKRQRQPTL